MVPSTLADLVQGYRDAYRSCRRCAATESGRDGDAACVRIDARIIAGENIDTSSRRV